MMAIRILLLVLVTQTLLGQGGTPQRVSAPFTLEGTVVSKPYARRNGELSFIVDAHTNRYAIHAEVRKLTNFTIPQQGDVVRLSGNCYLNAETGDSLYASTSAILGRQKVSLPQEISPIERLLDGASNCCPLRLRGRVIELVTDDLGGEWLFLILRSGIHTFYASTFKNEREMPRFSELVDAEVVLSGFAGLHTGDRFFRNPILSIGGIDDVEVLVPAPRDPFAVPPLERIGRVAPTAFAQFGRRRLSGQVLAICGTREFMLRDGLGMVHDVALAGEETVPRVAEFVEVSGYPETDLFHINLAHARVRSALTTNDVVTSHQPLIQSLRKVLYDRTKHKHVNVAAHGRRAVLRGRVRGIYRPEEDLSRMMLECEGEPLAVEIVGQNQAFANVEDDAIVEVRGILRVDTENWRPERPLPRVRGLSLILISPTDVVVVTHPPWWTPAKLLIVIGVLLVVLATVFMWNRVLERIVRRRSRALAREELDREKAELRVQERTRLAVELHDSLSQNLTGVAFEIDAAERARKKNPALIARHHLIARQALRSCREELKNCLWDLRHLALDTEDSAHAIRATLEPCLGEANLSVTFAIDRQQLDDVSFHAIIRIVRELATNAVRHGGAQEVCVTVQPADNNRYTLLVRDNGCGFDPAHCPGSAEGHYGLEGIRERVVAMGGTFSITSSPGATLAQVVLPLERRNADVGANLGS